MPGRFITLEGSEGAGKTLQAERLADALRERGQHVRLTREPGGTRLGEAIRSIVLARGKDGDAGINARADALLFNAARAQLVAEVIEPALAAGETIVCARFSDSTLAYQGYGSGLPIDELRAIGAVATAGLRPDLTILLDVPPEVGLARKAADARNRFEASFDLEFHRRVRAGFLELARQEPDRWRVIDAARDPDAVFADVLAATGPGSAPAR
ncbi:MAG TPA: dTMP kinase [Patescibacteria group bacterium]|nr:dTMP kinase [Patescibacteria group bacterium]